ncbi:MAG TPA: hypothetical protein DEF80_04085, partial [Pantoea sp.]|nr:hypothetical protein [Pantoea sp.]
MMVFGSHASRQLLIQEKQKFYRRGFWRGIRSAEEQPEAKMSRQDVGERTVRWPQGVTKVPREAGRAGC